MAEDEEQKEHENRQEGEEQEVKARAAAFRVSPPESEREVEVNARLQGLPPLPFSSSPFTRRSLPPRTFIGLLFLAVEVE